KRSDRVISAGRPACRASAALRPARSSLAMVSARVAAREVMPGPLAELRTAPRPQLRAGPQTTRTPQPPCTRAHASPMLCPGPGSGVHQLPQLAEPESSAETVTPFVPCILLKACDRPPLDWVNEFGIEKVQSESDPFQVGG